MAASSLTVVPPLVVCEDCGGEVEPGVEPVGLFRPVPGAAAGKAARPNGRRYREYQLCRRCRGEALRRRAMNGGTVMENGVKRALRTRERVPPKKGGRPRLLTDEQLRAAHVVYDRAGISMPKLAERLKAASTKGTEAGFCSALLLGWRRLGLPVRERGKAMAMARFGTDGTKSKPQLRRCSAVARMTGKRCRCWAQRGSAFCWDHRHKAL